MSGVLYSLLQNTILVGLLGGQLPVSSHTPMSLTQIENLGAKLKTHVAYVTAKEKQASDSPISDQLRDGFGVVLSENTVAIMSLILQDTVDIELHGPSGQKLKGRIIAEDSETRITLVRSRKSLSSIGLRAVQWLPQAQFRVDLAVFALSSTIGKPELREFFITHTGGEAGFEGTPRLNRPLQKGMPVFNSNAQCLGFARAGLWDVDKNLLVPAKALKDALRAKSTTIEARTP